MNGGEMSCFNISSDPTVGRKMSNERWVKLCETSWTTATRDPDSRVPDRTLVVL